MAEARVYPERPLIQMFLAGYEQGVWKDATLNWVEETKKTRWRSLRPDRTARH